MSAPALVEHFFRHEYGRLVSSLVARTGARHLAAIEDAVQGALHRALQRWPAAGLPDDPTAWLYRVARNNLISELRRSANRRELLALHQGEFASSPEDAPTPPTEGEIRDELLKMLFLCCDETIPTNSKLTLALKVLCGFDVREIAIRLFTTEANIYKRLERARAQLQSVPFPSELIPQDYAARLGEVHRILYTLFTEGYLSARESETIRKELCAEAIRLAALLADHPVGQTPETFALLALMYLHSARVTARQDLSGGLLLLEEQDRTRWNRREIAIGLSWLARSANGERFSRYHAEAGIAAEHCLAARFSQTRWDRVSACYELLERSESSAPLHRLNRAVAIAEWKGPSHGLAVLDGFVPPNWLTGSYQWAAVLADLHRRCGNLDKAAVYRERAIGLAPTAAIAALLNRRLAL